MSEGGPDWCYSHHRSEPIAPDGFFTCMECGHHWPTVGDFEADARRTLDEIGGVAPGDWPGGLANLPFCPLCAHDF